MNIKEVAARACLSSIFSSCGRVNLIGESDYSTGRGLEESRQQVSRLLHAQTEGED
jgi:hypothetical protein